MIKDPKGVVVQIHGNQYQKFIFLMLILYTFLYSADTEIQNFSYVPGVKVLLSDTEIVAGHVVRIKIRANGDQVLFPNIEEIDGVPVLERHERITNKYHYINGVLNKERTTLILTFAPHHDVIIPSYEVKIDGKIFKTKPVKIKVVSVNDQNKEDGNKFFLHLITDKKSVIAGEPIIVTVNFSLKNGIRLSKNPQYTQPLFKGFFSKQLGDEIVYSKGNRQITELKYLLIPQLEGNFNVGPAKVKIGIPNSRKLDMFGRVIGTSWIPIVSNTIKINVTDKPKESDLIGDFSIESHLNIDHVKANKPVNLTLKIAGEGTLEDFEFHDFEIDGVTIYSDDAEIVTELSNSTVHSTYSKSFVFISDRDFTIPEQRISVYDIKSKTIKYLEVPSYDVHVEGSQIQAQQKPQIEISYAGKMYNNLNISQKSMLDSEEEYDLTKVQFAPWWMIVLAFVFGLLVMYLFQYLLLRKWKRKGSKINEDEAFKILYSYTNESQEIENMVRKLYMKKNGDKSIIIDKSVLKRLVEKCET